MVLAAAKALILLLCGGDKSTQSKDITLAAAIAQRWEIDDDP